MFKKLLIASVLAGGCVLPSAASDYYLGVSFVDSEISGDGIDLEDDGYAITIGRSIGISSAVDTALEFSIANLQKMNIDGVELTTETMDLSLLVSNDYGRFSPFVRFAFSDGEIEASVGGASVKSDDKTMTYGLGVDYAVNDSSFIRLELTDGEYSENGSDVDVETTRFGVFTKF